MYAQRGALMAKAGLNSSRIFDGAALRIVLGGIAGIIATEAMTAAAAEMFRRLPAHERYPLPPREITDRMFRSLGKPMPADSGRVAATLANHFMFGAGAGALYYLLPVRQRTPISGVAYAWLVWAASYFGWVPAFKFLAPASRHPLRRNGLMIAAHVVWGVALWASGKLLSQSLTPLRAGPAMDAKRLQRRSD
jgi:hypothetical protein